MWVFFIYYFIKNEEMMELGNIPKIDYFLQSPKSRCTERHVKIRFPDLYNILLQYDDCSKFTERLYRYYHNILIKPVCPICGKKVKFWNFIDGYSTYCSYKCMYKSQDRQENYKKTMMLRYGVENASQSEILKEKKKQTTRKHYGVDWSLSSKYVREKGQQTMLKKYGVKSINDSFKYDNDFSKLILEKRYQTKKKNHTFSTSELEQKFKQYLTDNNINFKYQYKSQEYPFTCDFYFPDKDIYLEIQGSWTHGKHPYNKNNPDDQIILEKWINKHTKYYDNAVDVWAVRDPMKRQWAKDNNLNWYELFTIKFDDLVEWINRTVK